MPPFSSGKSKSGGSGSGSGSDRGALVPPELLSWLAEQNGMDAELHAMATRQLDAAREKWRREGRLKQLSAEEERRAMAAAAAAADGPRVRTIKAGGGVDERDVDHRQQHEAAVV